MDDIGKILTERGLVSRDDLARAREIQARRGGRLGPLLASIGAATQADIDAAWVDACVRPNVLASVDRASGNRFTVLEGFGIEFTSVHRHDGVTEDMLAGASVIDSAVTITGEAVLNAGKQRSLPIRFEIDASNGFGVLDDNSEAIAKRWVDLMVRSAQTTSTEDTGTVAPNFEAALGKLLGDQPKPTDQEPADQEPVDQDAA